MVTRTLKERIIDSIYESAHDYHDEARTNSLMVFAHSARFDICESPICTTERRLLEDVQRELPDA